MIEPAEDLLRQPLHSVAEVSATDIPVEPGIYAWYLHGTLLYVGESHRGLRSRLWGNHLCGNARGSTLRNKLAKALGFPTIGFWAYGRDAEKVISAKLLECHVRFLPLPHAQIDQAQADLIRELDPPMNDHPGLVPRWRVDEIVEILGVSPGPTSAVRRSVEDGAQRLTGYVESQRVTVTDIRAGRIRFPREAKRYFPKKRCEVEVVLRGERLDARYDPRTGPDKERSAVLLVGKARLARLVRVDEVLSVTVDDRVIRLGD